LAVTPPDPAPFTHRVAVGAYIFHDGRVLLLKRRNSPFTFAPPGGRLSVEEDPVAGIQREVFEETGLRIRLIGLAHVWFGSMDGRMPELLCINYLAESEGSQVRLSEEHSGFVWASREEIASGAVVTLNEEGYGYKPQDILRSFDLHSRLTGERWEEP
jgi:8-oxo-dGTP diphosphatase